MTNKSDDAIELAGQIIQDMILSTHTESRDAAQAILAADPLRAALGEAAVAAILAGEACVLPLDIVEATGLKWRRLDKPNPDHIADANKMVKPETGHVIERKA